MSKVAQVVATVTAFFEEVLGKAAVVLAVSEDERGMWVAKAEVPEEVEYMRKRARDDLMGLYQVTLDNGFNVVGYERIAIRERNNTSYDADEV
jgi:phenylpyruvate tautomerase PptA (4-oxalocrotonate tautomerase family)